MRILATLQIHPGCVCANFLPKCFGLCTAVNFAEVRRDEFVTASLFGRRGSGSSLVTRWGLVFWVRSRGLQACEFNKKIIAFIIAVNRVCKNQSYIDLRRDHVIALLRNYVDNGSKILRGVLLYKTGLMNRATRCRQMINRFCMEHGGDFLFCSLCEYPTHFLTLVNTGCDIF